MAEYKCVLGGREREFKYTKKERVEFEARFKAGMWDTIRKHVLALNEEDEPTPGGMVEAQHALVYLGLRHAGPKVTEANVSLWLEQLVEQGGNVFSVYTTASTAVLVSGVLGYKYTPPSEDEEADPKENPDAQTEPSASES